MTDEKQFGQPVEEGQSILSAADLLQLQQEEPWDIEFATTCTVCTGTCAVTSVIE